MLLSVLSFLLLFVSVSAHSQTTVGLRAGVNLSNIHYVDEAGDSGDTRSLPRFQIGLTVDAPLGGGLFLQPGLLYSGKGYKQDGGWLAAPGNDFEAKASYIELPLNLLFRRQFGNGNIIVGAGPYVGYGLGGNWETAGSVSVGDIVLSENEGDIIFKNDVMDGEFGNYLFGKPFDYGANVLLGYGFMQRFSVQLNVQFGVANLQPEISGAEPRGTLRNNSYGISIGYRF